MPVPDESQRPPRATYSAPALEKGLEIIELLAEERRPMSTREIAQRLGRSKGEIFRVVFVLVERGYLRRDGASDELTLSNRLFELGMRTPRARELIEVAVPAMEELSDACGQSAHLVVVNNGETVVVASTAGQSEISFTLRLGYRRPALTATSGRIILAFQDAATRARLIEEGLAQAPEPVDLAALGMQLDAIRVLGYLIAESRDVVGVTDIGAPVLDRDGRGLASIVVPYLNRHGSTPRHDQVLERLRSCCRGINEALG